MRTTDFEHIEGYQNALREEEIFESGYRLGREDAIKEVIKMLDEREQKGQE